jgi:hypothetical protein
MSKHEHYGYGKTMEGIKTDYRGSTHKDRIDALFDDAPEVPEESEVTEEVIKDRIRLVHNSGHIGMAVIQQYANVSTQVTELHEKISKTRMTNLQNAVKNKERYREKDDPEMMKLKTKLFTLVSSLKKLRSLQDVALPSFDDTRLGEFSTR